MEVLYYVQKRILTLIPVLIGISLCSFFLGKIAPGDPVEQALFARGVTLPTEEETAQMREDMGLNDPVFVQYLRWLSLALKGDFGESYFTNVSISDEFMRRIPVTLKLASIAMGITLLFSYILGISMVMYRNTWVDHLLRVLSVAMVSIPSFWLAMLLIILFSEKLQWLPTSGNGGILHMIMPAITLSCSTIGTVSRVTRATLLKELGEQYIVVAMAKGLRAKLVVIRHASRNAFVPILSLMGNYFAGILGGATVVESIFALNGMGSYMLAGIRSNDYLVIQAYVLYTGCIYVSVTLVIDLLYMVANPKIRLMGDGK